MYVVILCGGSGTRLWPLSRKNFAKQFLRLYSEQSLLQETYFRARKFVPGDRILFVTNESGFPNVLSQIGDVDRDFDPSRILIEPKSLNTAPAIACAVKHLLSQRGATENEVVVSLHSDHYIRDTEEFIAIIRKAAANVGDDIGTIGIAPTGPETGYGYIHKGKLNEAGHYEVSEFCEKPPLDRAKRYIETGEYVWNSGIYLFRIKTLLRELGEHAPEIAALMREDWETFLDRFHELPSISIDNAVSERSKSVVVFEGDFGWSDVGSFDSLAEIRGNRFPERHIGIDSKGVFVHSESNRIVATIGLEDVMVVESDAGILVCKRGESAKVKQIVEMLEEGITGETDRNGLDFKTKL